MFFFLKGELLERCQRIGPCKEILFLASARRYASAVTPAKLRAQQRHLEWETATINGPVALRAVTSARKAASNGGGISLAWKLFGSVHVKLHAETPTEAEIGARFGFADVLCLLLLAGL